MCAWRHNMPRPSSPWAGAQAPRAPPSRRNVAVLSHAEYVPTLTAAAALCVKTALSKAVWWPWPFDLERSRVTWAISVPILVFLGLSVLDLGPMYATDRQTSDVRRASLNASALWGRGITRSTQRSQTSAKAAQYIPQSSYNGHQAALTKKGSLKIRETPSWSG